MVSVTISNSNKKKCYRDYKFYNHKKYFKYPFITFWCPTHDQPNQIELKTSRLATDRSEIRVGSDGSSPEGGRVSVGVGSGRN